MPAALPTQSVTSGYLVIWSFHTIHKIRKITLQSLRGNYLPYGKRIFIHLTQVFGQKMFTTWLWWRSNAYWSRCGWPEREKKKKAAAEVKYPLRGSIRSLFIEVTAYSLSTQIAYYHVLQVSPQNMEAKFPYETPWLSNFLSETFSTACNRRNFEVLLSSFPQGLQSTLSFTCIYPSVHPCINPSFPHSFHPLIHLFNKHLFSAYTS